jgi:hypothetical protein
MIGHITYDNKLYPILIKNALYSTGNKMQLIGVPMEGNPALSNGTKVMISCISWYYF